jgi:hypothetical protein
MAIETGGWAVDRGFHRRCESPAARFEFSRGQVSRGARAIDATGGDTLLVGRAENFLWGRPDLDDTIVRLKAYAEAGADCL